ncbi:MAG: transaldolase [Steroidobacteraceae bacterium]
MNDAKQQNPLMQLKTFGQSIWLDDIRRAWLNDGTLATLIGADGICGLTSNPAIFRKSIVENHDYDAAIARLAQAGADVQTMYETLVMDDVRAAADLLLPTYESTQRRDGYVSLEVSPHLAHDTPATIAEAQRLWNTVARPNLMIKVPGTAAGLPAIRRLIAAGINVNVTLLFSVERYRETAEAYLVGLEDRLQDGKSPDGIASVASFFLSRIDVLIDKRLDSGGMSQLRGKAAIASARLAYQVYRQLLTSPRWQALARHGAVMQRLLWASTGTKDPGYSDVKYVEALIGADTVNTVPLETLAAYRDHGVPASRLEQELNAAQALPGQLAAAGIDLQSVAQQLEAEGIQKFIEPFEQLHVVLAQRRADAIRPPR